MRSSTAPPRLTPFVWPVGRAADVCRRAQMLCVSEYLPNGNLEVAIRKDRERKDGKPRLLGWYMQGRPIAVDVARGLAFLHTHKARAPECPKPCWARCIASYLHDFTFEPMLLL